MQYFDSHAHLWDNRFVAELGTEETEALIASLLAGEVPYIVNVATDPGTARLAIAQASRYAGMYTALGIHPNDGQELSDPAGALLELEALLRAPASRAVALGEIGLDYHYDNTDKEKQKALFHAQMQMAERLSLPVVIHDREAHGDTVAVVREYPRVTGIFHSFSGSAEMAKELCSLGYYISFSGTVSFKNAERVRAAAAAVPRERLLIETDCPYLTPHPYRGKLNHPGYLAYTNAALAEALGLTPEECARLTTETALRVFGIQ